MKKAAVRALQILLIASLAVYCGDWLIFRIRLAHGSAYSTVKVNQYLSTALKGNKQEYDYLGTSMEQCSRSLFPRAGEQPCWWVRRHTEQWE